MESQIENPFGLHARYSIKKLSVVKNPKHGADTNSLYGKRNVDQPEFIIKAEPVNPDADYFVLRLDAMQSDPHHRSACLIAVRAYAEAIKEHLPQLSEEILRKYPLL